MRRILLDNHQEDNENNDMDITDRETQNDTIAHEGEIETEAKLNLIAHQTEDRGRSHDNQPSQPHSHRPSDDMSANGESDDNEQEVEATTETGPQPLLKKRSSGHFIKSYDEDDEESEQLGPISWMNEWGIYQALRLAQIKQRLMRPVERLRQLRAQEPVMEEEEEREGQWSPNTEELLEGEDEQWTAEEWEGQEDGTDELESEGELNEDEFLEEEGILQGDSEPDNASLDDQNGSRDRRDS